MDKYVDELFEVIHKDRMYDYEETNMCFIAAKLIQLSFILNRRLVLILRSDFIDGITYWFIRYFRSKNVEPSGILSTNSNKEKYLKISGIPIITIDELNKDNAKNSILIIINRESDTGVFTQPDYREADYGFYFRARGKMEFFRERGVENFFNIIQHENEYYEVLGKLNDEISKKTFIEVIRSLIENDIYRYIEYRPELKYFDESIYQPVESEVWINCGSCSGDTILHYLSMKRKFKKIYAVEIEEEKISHLHKLFDIFQEEVKRKIVVYDRMLGGLNTESSLDYVFDGEKITFINMDIEGAERMVLEGASEIIKKNRPVIAVAAYHKAEDLLWIPNYILEQNEDYGIYLRKYRGYCPEAMNEYVYYAVPKERMVLDKIVLSD